MAKNVINDEQREDARKLKAIYSAKAKSLGLTQEKLGVSLGGSGQSTASNYINGVTALNLKAALVFAKELEVDVQEFSPSLAKLIAENRENVQAFESKTSKVPLISWIAAGSWCESPDNFAPGDAEDWLDSPYPHSKTAFCLEVVGQSMMPEYREGEIILVDPEITAEHGDDIVARTPDNTHTFKRLQITPEGTYLLAINPDHPERIIKMPVGTHICGVVTASWIRRRNRKK